MEQISELGTWLGFPLISGFQPFSSHGTQKLITKFLWHTKNIFFANLTKNSYTFDLLTPLAIVVLAVVIFFI